MEKGKEARWLSRVREGSHEVSAITREVAGDISSRALKVTAKALGFTLSGVGLQSGS